MYIRAGIEQPTQKSVAQLFVIVKKIERVETRQQVARNSPAIMVPLQRAKKLCFLSAL
jgi:hypothetical protein